MEEDVRRESDGVFCVESKCFVGITLKHLF